MTMFEEPGHFEYDASWAMTPYFYLPPCPDLMTPMDFQNAGVEYQVRRRNGLIGDAPGLGKTIEAILLSNAIGALRTLVVCPASLRLNWEREIWKWSTIPNVTTYVINKSKDGASLQHNYCIVSYDLVKNPHIHAALMDGLWDHVIFDEAHALKDPQGNQRTKAICGWVSKGEYIPGLCEVAGRMTLLSGTILPNQPIECYNAIRLIDHEAINLASLEDFREFYYGMGEGMVRTPVWDEARQAMISTAHWSDEVRNVPRNLLDLQYRLRSKIMVRRLKEDVLPQLPPKQWHPFPIQIDADIRRAMKHEGWSAAAKLYDMDPHAFDAGVPIDGAVSTARRLIGEAKAPAVARYIKELIEEEGLAKIVVSAWHHSVLQYLRDELSKYGLVYMDGTTSTKNKQKAVDQFQLNRKLKIILGQQLPLGEGWTLTEAQDVVFAEFDWVPGKNDQLLDRINRMGQTGAYTIGHVPVVPNSLEERMLSTAIVKDRNIHLALDAR